MYKWMNHSPNHLSGRNYYKEHGDSWPGQDEPGPGLRHPSPKYDFLVVLMMAVSLSLLRAVFEKYIASPVAWAIGIKQCKRQKIESVPVLEEYLKSSRYIAPNGETLKNLCSLSGLTEKQAQVWIRRKQQSVLSTRHTKFMESFWRLAFYSSTFIFGLACLWNEEYLWDTQYCWHGYPTKIWAMKDNIYWYYMFEMGYYSACLIYQFYEVRRKDFLQMFVHHVAAVSLISMSFVTSRTRIGALVMLLHDFSDISLEACKMAKYAKRLEVANVLFALFAMSFFLCRIVYFPYCIIYSAIVETRTIANIDGPSLDVLCGLLIVLYFLHCYWFSLILKVVSTFLTNGQPEGDVRSEEEAPSSSGDEESDVKKIE